MNPLSHPSLRSISSLLFSPFSKIPLFFSGDGWGSRGGSTGVFSCHPPSPPPSGEKRQVLVVTTGIFTPVCPAKDLENAEPLKGDGKRFEEPDGKVAAIQNHSRVEIRKLKNKHEGER